MDTTVSTSTVLLGSSIPQARKAIASTATSNQICCNHVSYLNNRVFFRSPLQSTRRLTSKSPHSYTVTKFSINCSAIKEITETEFPTTVLKSDRPVLVEFVAPWCGPCKLMSTILESVAQEYKDRLTVVKIDHDTNPKLIKEYKIFGLPAFILFKDGKEVSGSRKEGPLSKIKLKEHLDSFLETTSVA